VRSLLAIQHGAGNSVTRVNSNPVAPADQIQSSLNCPYSLACPSTICTPRLVQKVGQDSRCRLFDLFTCRCRHGNFSLPLLFLVQDHLFFNFHFHLSYRALACFFLSMGVWSFSVSHSWTICFFLTATQILTSTSFDFTFPSSI
jgi:hypothetical protein